MIFFSSPICCYAKETQRGHVALTTKQKEKEIKKEGMKERNSTNTTFKYVTEFADAKERDGGLYVHVGKSQQSDMKLVGRKKTRLTRANGASFILNLN